METIYIASLHRPFNQQLKTSRWVCEFISSLKKTTTSSSLNSEFYYYLILLLEQEYKKETPENFKGLPSDIAVNSIKEYLSTRSKTEFIKELPDIVKSRSTALEKQIYSTYKAATYYINLAKDKFALINDKNNLTEKGNELLDIRSSNFRISAKEKDFFFERILFADFHLFLTHCFFSKLALKYNLKSFLVYQSEFLTKYLNIKHFNFTTTSLGNYNIVRTSWVDSLGVLDKNGNIRKKFMEIIRCNINYDTIYIDLKSKFKIFEDNNFKLTRKSENLRKLFLEIYRKKLKSGNSDQGYINVNDIKDEIRISSSNFQKLLVDFYEEEKKYINIFFTNTVNSIDTRERFFIRNRPVNKIKIKDKY